VRFVSTHDHARLATLARGGLERSLLGHLSLLALPGALAFVAGEELGLAADTIEHRPEGAWADRMPLPTRPTEAQQTHRELFRRLLAARHGSAALREGRLALVHGEGSVLVLRRVAGAEIVD